ncbi:MAG TPA: PA2779 family protein [Steroidobacteraceae bacterium]|nr:PA2779 family protein [Steroidobacteraceae bacterium]
MRIDRFRRACVAVLSASLISLCMQTPAAAGMVGTAEAIASERNGARAAIDATLARADVRAELERMGVDPAAVEGRLDALSEAELAALADQVGEAPAGGDALAVIGIVFVILLILELVGVIDIFKKT